MDQVMEYVIKSLPFLPKEKDTAGLVKAILYHIAVNLALNLVVWPILMILLIGFLIFPILGLAQMVYFWGGIVLSIMAYCGTDVANLFAKKEESAE